MTREESPEPAPPLDAAAIAAKIEAAQALLARADGLNKLVSISEYELRVMVSNKVVEDDQLNVALRQAIKDKAQEYIASLLGHAQRLLAEAAGGGDK